MASRRRPVWFLEPDVFSGWMLEETRKRYQVVSNPSDAEILFARIGCQIDGNLLDGSPALRVVACPATGVEHIDFAECHRRNIAVLTLKGETRFLEGLTNTSEHAFGLLLALYRRLIPAHTDVLAGNWRQSPYRGRTLSGKTFGIVGYGRLGRIAARIAEGFGMDVLAYDPYVRIRETSVDQLDSLTALAERSQVLSLHADLNDRNHGMVNAMVFDRMPDEGVLINTARGQLVDESALLNALEEKRIAGAGLDVVCSEISFDHEHRLSQYARTHDNLVLSPHIGGQTVEAVKAADQFILEKLDAWYRDNDS